MRSSLIKGATTIFLLIGFLFSGTAVVQAQDTSNSASIEALQRQVQQLRERVQDIQSQLHDRMNANSATSSIASNSDRHQENEVSVKKQKTKEINKSEKVDNPSFSTSSIDNNLQKSEGNTKKVDDNTSDSDKVFNNNHGVEDSFEKPLILPSIDRLPISEELKDRLRDIFNINSTRQTKQDNTKEINRR